MGESPREMLAPMFVLGVASVVAGFLVNPQWINFIWIPKHWITEFLLRGLEHNLLPLGAELHAPDFSPMMALASTGIALAGLGLAWLLYRSWTKQGVDKKEPLRMAGPVHRLLSEKYYMDALYEGAVVRRFSTGDSPERLTGWTETWSTAWLTCLGGYSATSVRWYFREYRPGRSKPTERWWYWEDWQSCWDSCSRSS